MRAKDRAYRQANHESVRAADRARYRANPEQKRAYQQANAEKVRVRYQANAEKERARSRAYRLTHPEWAQAKTQNRRACLHAAPGTLTAADWTRILTASKGRCHYCKKRRKLTIDHVIPLSRGGAHVPENVVAACKPCNDSKGARQWLIA